MLCPVECGFEIIILTETKLNSCLFCSYFQSYFGSTNSTSCFLAFVEGNVLQNASQLLAWSDVNLNTIAVSKCYNYNLNNGVVSSSFISTTTSR